MALEDTYIGKGISLQSGFDYQSQKPLDSRLIVKNESGLTSLLEIAYKGMFVYVEDVKKTYQYQYIPTSETSGIWDFVPFTPDLEETLWTEYDAENQNLKLNFGKKGT